MERYAASLEAEAERYAVELGEPRHDDDDFAAKLALVVAEGVEIVSFTFGCPQEEVVVRLREAGCDVWVTVTNPEEASEAHAAGATALVVQGFEAGGHRGYFSDNEGAEDLGLLVALRLVSTASTCRSLRRAESPTARPSPRCSAPERRRRRSARR